MMPKRVYAPARNASEADDHLGVLCAYVFHVAPDLVEIGGKVLRAGVNDLICDCCSRQRLARRRTSGGATDREYKSAYRSRAVR
jgi:hypothetical protein